MLLETVVVILLLLATWVAFICWRQAYWKRHGIPTLRTSFLLGSLGETLRKKKTAPNVILDLYNEAQARGLPYGGMYLGTQASLLVVNKDLLKAVTVEYFDHFTDRRPAVEKGVDELLSRSLLSLRGEEWRDMRHTLSPAFTGSKLRRMVPLMARSGRQVAHYLTTLVENEVDLREVYRRYAADVIATTAYGTVSDSIKDPKSDFYANGSRLMEFKGLRKLVLAGYILTPALMRTFNIKFLPRELNDFFETIIRSNIKLREETGLTRPDMIQLLLDQRKNKNSAISDADIVAQAFTFFLGGFETVASALSYFALELAANPDVQARLRAEVDDVIARTGGDLIYDDVQGLKYMDMVFSEVLRLHPVVPFSDRSCTKSIHLPDYNFKVEVGDKINLPYYAYHHDPQNFPDPDRFDPERFNDANKHDIKPFTYFPFGSGPRNCIGLRFAHLEVKLALIHTLAAVELVPGSEVVIPLQSDPRRIDNTPVGGFKVRIVPRTNMPWTNDRD